MSEIKWNKKYAIGHDRIDFEHQIFVDLIAKIDDASKVEKNEHYIGRLLEELLAYTKFHFISEENIMYSISYPDYEVHKRHHRELLEQYNRKMIEIELGEQIIEDFIVFLKAWFVSHTLTEDKKIASFVQGKHV